MKRGVFELPFGLKRKWNAFWMRAEQPYSFPSYDEEHHFALVRRFPYSVIYLVGPAGVHVVAIAHSSRAPGYWQERR